MTLMNSLSSSPKILVDLEDSLAWITFNNPQRRNAMSLEMWRALAAALEELAKHENLRVLILKGAGDKAFVAGADISEFEQQRNSQEQRDAYEQAFDRAMSSLAQFPRPVLAMIKGYCVGGGLALALNADIRIASQDSRFAIPAAKLGLGYGFEAIKTLSSVVGPALARDILFSARFIEGEEALRIGLINSLVPRQDLESTVTDYADRLAANAPLTIRSIKAAVSEVVRDPGQTSPAHIEELVNACFLSEDYIEGRNAFLEKRPPRFKGS